MKPHRSIATSLLAALSLSPAAGSAAPPAPQQAGPRRTAQTISPAPSQDASPAPPQADALSRTAGEMSAKGEEAQRQGKYDQCHAWFLAAWSIRPHKQIAGNLAACEVKLGLYRDAAEHLSFLAQAAPDGKATELLPEHRRLLDEALSKIAVVHLDAGSDALVLVDGKLVGQAPLSTPVYLEPGDHTLEARSSGGTARQTTRFDAGTQKRISLYPQAPSATPAPPPQEAPPAPREAPPPPPVAPAPPDTRVRDGVVIGGLALGGAALAAGVVARGPTSVRPTPPAVPAAAPADQAVAAARAGSPAAQAAPASPSSASTPSSPSPTSPSRPDAAGAAETAGLVKRAGRAASEAPAAPCRPASKASWPAAPAARVARAATAAAAAAASAATPSASPSAAHPLRTAASPSRPASQAPAARAKAAPPAQASRQIPKNSCRNATPDGPTEKAHPSNKVWQFSAPIRNALADTPLRRADRQKKRTRRTKFGNSSRLSRKLGQVTRHAGRTDREKKLAHPPTKFGNSSRPSGMLRKVLRHAGRAEKWRIHQQSLAIPRTCPECSAVSIVAREPARRSLRPPPAAVRAVLQDVTSPPRGVRLGGSAGTNPRRLVADGQPE